MQKTSHFICFGVQRAAVKGQGVQSGHRDRSGTFSPKAGHKDKCGHLA
jgi:hypothetical protein